GRRRGHGRSRPRAAAASASAGRAARWWETGRSSLAILPERGVGRRKRRVYRRVRSRTLGDYSGGVGVVRPPSHCFFGGAVGVVPPPKHCLFWGPRFRGRGVGPSPLL